MCKELSSAESFLKTMARSLEQLSSHEEECCPASEFDKAQMYTLGLASCLGLCVLDNRTGEESWLRLTPSGKRWLKARTPLDQLKAHVPLAVQ